MCLSLKNLSLRIGPHEIINGCNLAIPNHQVTGLLGESGIGKSTIARFLSAQILHGKLNCYASGKVSLDGKCLLKMAPDEVRKRVGYLPQEPVPLGFNILQEVTWAPTRNRWSTGRSKAEIRDRALEALEDVGLAGSVPLNRAASKLSGGEMRKLALARLAVQDPQIYVLDEPFVGLDPGNKNSIAAVISQLAAKKPCLLITHDIVMARWLAPRSGFLAKEKDGCRIVEFGSTNEIIEQPNHPAVVEYVRNYYRALNQGASQKAVA